MALLRFRSECCQHTGIKRAERLFNELSTR